MKEYAVIVEKSTNCWGAYAPDSPGLGVAGSTADEAETLIRGGINFHLESLLEDGDSIPEPVTRLLTVRTDIVETWKGRLLRSA